ncbi:MAG: hypothetical protein K2O62_01435 [Clostridia bacterium]|nr:hypothetical protein [Clostridia bacterium]
MVFFALDEVNEPEAEPLALLKVRSKVEADISAYPGTLPEPFALVGLVAAIYCFFSVTAYAKVGATFAVFASALTLLSLFKNEKTVPRQSPAQNKGVSI